MFNMFISNIYVIFAIKVTLRAIFVAEDKSLTDYWLLADYFKWS